MRVRLYGVGGCGTNRVCEFLEQREHMNHRSQTELLPAILDTSEANLKGRQVPQDSVYLIPDLDGSGKVRSENHQEISRWIRRMINEVSPQEFNVIVFSASGGSGSVIGPLLIKELNERRLPVIGIVVGSHESVISCNNTLNTLMSLESIAEKTELPVVINYQHNETNEPRTRVDETIHGLISSFLVLASDENREMDRKDLEHFLHFSKLSGKPQLATIHVSLDAEQLQAVDSPVTIASIYDREDRPQAQITADYVTIGYGDLSNFDSYEMHFAITTTDIDRVAKGIRKKVKELRENQSARVERDSLMSIEEANGQQNDDGLVL